MSGSQNEDLAKRTQQQLIQINAEEEAAHLGFGLNLSQRSMESTNLECRNEWNSLVKR